MASIVIFLIVKTLIWVRVWLTERKLKMDGKFAGRKTSGGDVEMASVPKREGDGEGHGRGQEYAGGNF